jgi:regulator of sigma E protease
LSFDWVWSIPVFGLLIFIHELGHFGVAKFFDIRVHEFALGFGPILGSLRRGETRYSLRAIPLGGFVRMAGMEEADLEDSRGFNKKSLFARALTIAAGPAMNFLLAIVLYAVFFGVRGDASVPIIESVVPDTPAAQAGFAPGDRILAIDGRPISHWMELIEAVRHSGGKPLRFEVQRGAARESLEVTPASTGEPGAPYRVGLAPKRTPLPPGRAVAEGASQTWEISVHWFSAVGQMITGRMKAELSGPIGIAQVISEQAALGFLPLLTLSGFLSINLAMFNLLPIPALDGSRLIFLLLELLRGRRVDPQRENMVHFVGFVLLLGLMIWVTYQDFIRTVFQ